MLSFNLQVKRLVSTFLTHRNDIDVYTEDEEKDKEFYKSLLRRILDQRIVINDVTPLGSKKNVIERCKNEPFNGRKKIFIIDGDINLINGKQQFSYPNLYVHDSYCIENLLIDEQSISKFIYLQCAVRPQEEIKRDIDYQKWLSQYSSDVVSLFIHFAIVDSFGYNFKLGNAWKYHVNNGRSFVYDSALIRNEIDEIKRNVLKYVSQLEYDNELIRLTTKWQSDIDTLLTIVSGKDYLIPILLIKTKQFKQSQSMPSLQEVKMMLLEFSDLFRFRNLKLAIEAL